MERNQQIHKRNGGITESQLLMMNPLLNREQKIKKANLKDRYMAKQASTTSNYGKSSNRSNTTKDCKTIRIIQSRKGVGIKSIHLRRSASLQQ